MLPLACFCAVGMWWLHRRGSGFLASAGLIGLAGVQSGPILSLETGGTTLWPMLALLVICLSLFALADGETIRRVIVFAAALSCVQFAGGFASFLALGVVPAAVAFRLARGELRQQFGYYSMLLFAPLATGLLLGWWRCRSHCLELPPVGPHYLHLREILLTLGIAAPSLAISLGRAGGRDVGIVVAATVLSGVGAVLLRLPIDVLSYRALAAPLTLASIAAAPEPQSRRLAAAIATALLSWLLPFTAAG